MFFFCELMDFDSVSVHKHARKERGQCPAISTEQALSIKDLFYGFRRNFFLQDKAGSPERARQLHLARSGSQSQHGIIRFIEANIQLYNKTTSGSARVHQSGPSYLSSRYYFLKDYVIGHPIVLSCGKMVQRSLWSQKARMKLQKYSQRFRRDAKPCLVCSTSAKKRGNYFDKKHSLLCSSTIYWSCLYKNKRGTMQFWNCRHL